LFNEFANNSPFLFNELNKIAQKSKSRGKKSPFLSKSRGKTF
jgi:hypothetical protein